MKTIAVALARQSLSILGLAFLDSHALRIALCPVILSLDVHLYQTLCGWQYRGDLFGYIYGCTIAHAAIATVYYLALTQDTRKTFRLRNSPDPRTISQKLRWSLRVHFSPRLIGFENQATKIPPPPSARRWEFIFQRIKYLVLSGIIVVAAWSAVFKFGFVDFLHPAEGRLPSLKQEAIRRLCSTVLCQHTLLWGLNAHYGLFSIVSVGLGLTEPKDWPPLFGSIFEATTLSNCWSRVWHQILRNIFTGYGDLVARMMGAPQGSRIWWCIKVITAFIISGLLHAAGDYAMLGGRVWFSPQFFMVQPIPLLFEAAVIRMADRYKFRQRYPVISTAIGYAWVLTWFSLTFPAYTHELWRPLYLNKFFRGYIVTM